jgi:hypothetical protein
LNPGVFEVKILENPRAQSLKANSVFMKGQAVATIAATTDIEKLEHLARIVRLDIVQMIGVGQRGLLGG